MRHGWQMCYLLMNHFGYSGKVEAQKMLERRAFDQKRLLGAFNQDVNNWLDFFVYTDFVDRDGKYQLTMLSYSGFAPLAQSMIPMLKEESFHLGTGQDGIKRIVKAGAIPHKRRFRNTSTNGFPSAWICLALTAPVPRTGFTFGA